MSGEGGGGGALCGDGGFSFCFSGDLLVLAKISSFFGGNER